MAQRLPDSVARRRGFHDPVGGCDGVACGWLKIVTEIGDLGVLGEEASPERLTRARFVEHVEWGPPQTTDRNTESGIEDWK